MPQRKKVLIVDDAEISRSLLSDMLSEEYDISEASNGLEAAAQLNRFHAEISLVLLDIVMLALLLCGALILTAYQNETARTVARISRVYLQEMTKQIDGYFKTNMDSQLAQLRTIALYLSQTEIENEEELRHFLHQVQKENGFDQAAVISDKGMAYAADRTFPASSKITEQDRLLFGEEPLISFNETIWDADMLLLGLPIKKKAFGDENLAAIVIGIDASVLDQRLALGKEGTDSYTSIIARDGSFVIASNYKEAPKYGANFFSTLSARAEFDKGYSLEAPKGQIAGGGENPP